MKYCIFDEKKVCNDCGECNICEYNRDNNCGKCLEIEGYDVKAVKIDEVFEKNKEEEIKINLEDFSDFDTIEEEDSFEGGVVPLEEDEIPYIDALDDESNWDYISDIEGMDELMEETGTDGLLHEEYPGLYIVNNKR